MEAVRVYVGADRSQWIGVRVLEYSIRRHTKCQVEVYPMVDLPVPVPKDAAQDQRTGFSFSRFCIPKLAGYQGRAIYMDADMLVFKDIRELWELPFGPAHVLIQEELNESESRTRGKKGAPSKRIKQSSVMLLDCDRLQWDIEDIVRRIDAKEFDYAGLMYELRLVPEEHVGYSIPFRWNSLEHFDSDTCLIHYTDMRTQPWVNSLNPHGPLWVNELSLALADGFVTLDQVEQEIDLGYARPSLLVDLLDPLRASRLRRLRFSLVDRLRGFRPHAVAHADRVRHLKVLREAHSV